MSKDTAKYWLSRLIRKTYEYNGKTHVANGWYIRPTIKGKRGWIALGTDNKASAAQRAATLYDQIRREGWESISNHAPKQQAPLISDLLDAAQRLASVDDRAYRTYRHHILAMAKDFQGIETPQGENADWYTAQSNQVAKLPIAIFTPEAIEEWRVKRLKSGSRPATVNSMLTSGKALFRESVCTALGVSNPFAKVKAEKIGSQATKYKSQFDLAAMIRKITADRYITEDGSLDEVYKILILLAASGARKNELDKLEWRHLNLEAGTITFEGDHLKNDSSAATIQLAEFALEPLRTFPRIGRYVLDGCWHSHNYRCEKSFNLATKWLRSYEENGEKPFTKIQKPLHTIRKEVGSVLYKQTRDIHAVQQFLRHATIAITISYYVDGGERIAPKIEL
jgi:integrase